MVKRLAEMNIIREDDPRSLYVPHHGDGREDYCISRTDRLRIVVKELHQNVNLGAAKLEGLLTDWFPVHSMHNLHRFAVTWASFRKLRDFTYVQPIPRIKVYFGARMAFMLGWLGNYCKMLVPLSVVACSGTQGH